MMSEKFAPFAGGEAGAGVAAQQRVPRPSVGGRIPAAAARRERPQGARQQVDTVTNLPVLSFYMHNVVKLLQN